MASPGARTSAVPVTASSTTSSSTTTSCTTCAEWRSARATSTGRPRPPGPRRPTCVSTAITTPAAPNAGCAQEEAATRPTWPAGVSPNASAGQIRILTGSSAPAVFPVCRAAWTEIATGPRAVFWSRLRSSTTSSRTTGPPAPARRRSTPGGTATTPRASPAARRKISSATHAATDVATSGHSSCRRTPSTSTATAWAATTAR